MIPLVNPLEIDIAAEKHCVTTWGDGALRHYAAKTKTWTPFKPLGLGPRDYSTYVDKTGKAWGSDLDINLITQFVASNQTFTVLRVNKQSVQTLQINSTNDHAWASQQGVDQVAPLEYIKE